MTGLSFSLFPSQSQRILVDDRDYRDGDGDVDYHADEDILLVSDFPSSFLKFFPFLIRV